MKKSFIGLFAFFVIFISFIETGKADRIARNSVYENAEITYDFSAKRKKRVKQARQYAAADSQYSYETEGGRPSDCPKLWCGCWLSKYLFGENRRELWSTFNWLKFPRTSPRIGAVVVTKRKGGGHVGVVTAFDSNGDPIIKSGNNRGAVRTGPIGRRQVIAYVDPR